MGKRARLAASLLSVLLLSATARAADTSPAAEPPLVGRIEIPRLNLSAPVREGSEDETLRLAVGHIEGTAHPGELGNSGLAAHRNTFFRPLKDVRMGDLVVVKTGGGVFSYRVDSIGVVAPTEVSVLKPTPKETLTLVTCYPFDAIAAGGPLRYVVSAVIDGDAGEPSLATIGT